MWHVAVDTTYETPQDLYVADEEPLCEAPDACYLGARSTVILVAREKST